MNDADRRRSGEARGISSHLKRAIPIRFLLPVLLAAGALTGALPATAAGPPAPGNDTLAAAQVLHSLPATISGTLVGATIEPLEASGDCGGTEHSVWYQYRAPAKQRVAIALDAAGTLDAAVEVFHAVRSELHEVTCQRTDTKGEASLTWQAAKNGVYDIRVAALTASQLATFTLEVYLPTPAVAPPGPRLPAAGVSGQVDRIQNVNAAYSVVLHSGVSYIVSLASETPHACVTGTLFVPGTTSFEEGSNEAPTALTLRCGGFALYTPGVGEGGVYSVELTPRESFKGVQRFHLQVAPAGPGETSPGLSLGNYGRVGAHLLAGSAQTIRLYRMDVTTHSNLTLRLHAAASAKLSLQLRDFDGHVIECQCGSSGPQTIFHQLEPGRYYAVVTTQRRGGGSFSLTRESRTITSVTAGFGTAHAAPGQPTPVEVTVSPAVSGPVTAEIQRFDPVFGWQFYRWVTGYAAGGTASLPFEPPTIGRWRVTARYGGSRTASPSATRGYTYLTVL